jgi:riboflavin kinase / FMN adenylyltransferase
MEILNISTTCKDNITSLAIGRFDGLHLGHFELFKMLTPEGGVLVIDTEKANLTPPHYLNYFLNLPFFIYKLAEIKNFSALEFVNLLKSDFPFLKKIVVGYDFRFGHDRSSGTSELFSLLEGYEVVILDEFKIDNIGVHSRLIRNLLLQGSVDKASALLGRNYMIFGKQIVGQGIGSKVLYPTVNTECKDFFLPAEGVYATRLLSKGKLYKSVTFLGHRLTTDGNYAIETNILEDDFDICDDIGIEFVAQLRNNIYFEKIEELKKQISLDIYNAKVILEKL